MQEERKPKKQKKTLIISLTIIAMLIIAAVVVYSFYPKQSSSSGGGTGSKNPVVNLSDEEAAQQFDESFVRYLLYSIDADELHKPPLSSNTPKIEMQIETEIFNAEIRENVIYIKKGNIENEDIIITTTKEEAIKMLRDTNYVSESFNSGLSQIQLIAPETTLFAKGYLSLYNQFSSEAE